MTAFDPGCVKTSSSPRVAGATSAGAAYEAVHRRGEPDTSQLASRMTKRFSTVEDGLELDAYWSSACPSCSIRGNCTTKQLPPTQTLEARSNSGGHAATVGSPTGDDECASTDRRASVWHAQTLDGVTHFLTKTLPRVSTEMSLHEPQTTAEHLRRQRYNGGTAGLRSAIFLRLSTTSCHTSPEKTLTAVNSLWSSCAGLRSLIPNAVLA